MVIFTWQALQPFQLVDKANITSHNIDFLYITLNSKLRFEWLLIVIRPCYFMRDLFVYLFKEEKKYFIINI